MPTVLVFRIGEEGEHTGVFELGSKPFAIQIGRNPDCDLIIPATVANHRTVSRVHARLCCRSDGSWLEDLGSSHFSFVGERVALAPLAVEFPCTLRFGRVPVSVAKAEMSPEEYDQARDLMYAEGIGELVATVGGGAFLTAEDRSAIWDEIQGNQNLLAAMGDIVGLLAMDAKADERKRQFEELLASHVRAERVRAFFGSTAKGVDTWLREWDFKPKTRTRVKKALKDLGEESPVKRVDCDGGRSVWLLKARCRQRKVFSAVVATMRSDASADDVRWSVQADDLVGLCVLTCLPLMDIHQELESIQAARFESRRNRPSKDTLVLARQQDLEGNSPAFLEHLYQIERAALGFFALSEPRGNRAILLTGETGTGKTAVARLLHALCSKERGLETSGKGAPPFENCILPDLSSTLVESALFGHMKGSFTGATEQHIGYFERAHGGTVFLDEIADFPPQLQAKLLGILESGEVRRLGGSGPVGVDVRIVAATNQNLENLVREKKFREDLLFRLNSFTIDVPPLRQRMEDLEILVENRLEELAKDAAFKPPTRVSDDLLVLFRSYPWPGNIRELHSILRAAASMAKDASEIRREHLLDSHRNRLEGRTLLQDHVVRSVDVGQPLHDCFLPFEREYLAKQVRACKGNLKKAAERTGIVPTTFYKKRDALREWLETEASETEERQVREWAGEFYHRLTTDSR